MDCDAARELLALYFDGELDRVAARELEDHLDSCAECRAALIELDTLRTHLRSEAPRYAAPDSLRDRLHAEMTRTIRPRARLAPARWLALAASSAFAFVLGGAAMLALKNPGGGDDQATRDLFASHWRALAATSPVDVVSTDRHTVKPWFEGKVAQAPVVRDFADSGFALAGGRIDYVGSERVPVLIYRHGQHVIDVFVLSHAAPVATERQGYALDPIRLGGQAAAVVSDMDAVERARFVELVTGAK